MIASANLKFQIASSRLLAVLLLFFATGCNIIGAAAGKIAPAPTIPAEYILGDEPTVVIAENWRNPAGSSNEAERLARFVFDDLHKHTTTPQIDPASVLDLKSKRENFRSMSVAQIGKSVGAKQVVYINITGSGVTGALGSESATAQCSARVKVIDAETGVVRWPEDAAQGFSVTAQTPMVKNRDDADETSLRLALNEQMAQRIARLFYKVSEDD